MSKHDRDALTKSFSRKRELELRRQVEKESLIGKHPELYDLCALKIQDQRVTELMNKSKSEVRK